MCIRFDKIDWYIKTYDGTTYLTLLDPKKYDVIYNKIRYPVSLKSGLTYIFSHYFANIKVYSYDSLCIQKRLILHNDIILIKLVNNKDKNNYYYKVLLEKWSYQFAKIQSQKIFPQYNNGEI